MAHHIVKNRISNNSNNNLLQRRTRLFHEVVERLEQRLLLAADLDVIPDAAGGPLPNQSLAWGGYDLQSTSGPVGGGIIKTIANVPAYLWTNGCGPTAAGMVMGYWDLHGYPNLVPGDATTQTTAVNDMIANAQHYNDYSLPLDSFGNILADKSSTGGAHVSNSIGDYMKTSWSSLALPYGWSFFDDVDSAMDSYANQRGYPGATVAEETWGAFTWSDLVGQIDAGRPMVFLVDSDGNGGTDHFVPIIGYDTGTTRYACYDTWDTNVHWYDFRAMSSSYSYGIYGATYFNPGPGAILPDLQGWDCYAPPSGVWGQTITVDSQIRNNAAVLVEDSFSVQYYLSNDTTFGDADDVLLGSYLHSADIPSSGMGPDYSVTLTLPEIVPAGYSATGTIYVGMRTDSTNAIAESNEANNFGTVGIAYDYDSVAVSPSYDLSGWDCYAPASANWGETITVQSAIRNTGSTTVTDYFYVDYYMSNDSIFGDADDHYLGYYTHSADVSGSGFGPDYTMDVTLPSLPPAGYATTGTIYIGMQTDSTGRINESDETNNFGTIGNIYDRDSLSISPSYDLAGWDCYAPPSANWGQTISVQSQVRNYGPSTVTDTFYADYYLSNDTIYGDADDIFLGSYNHGADVPGGGYGPDYTIDLTLPAGIPAGYAATGTIYIGMKTDATGLIAESNETNNFGNGTIGYGWDSVAVSPSYDLISWDFGVSTSPVVWGQTFTANSQVHNYGPTNVTGSFYVGYYVSNDTIYGDADDVMLGWYYHSDDVPAGGEGPDFTKDVALPATIPVGYMPTGTVYIYMATDDGGDIGETDEWNNRAILLRTTGVSYDLSGWDCYTPTSGTWGQTITVNSQIRNAGPTTVTGAFYVDYYLSNDTVFGDAGDALLGWYYHSADVPGSGLGPDFSKDLVLPSTIPAGYPVNGTIYIGMKTDSTGLIAESNETNNFGTIGATYDWGGVGVSASQDLIGWDFAPTTSPLVWGKTFSADCQVHNNGVTNITAPFYVDYYISNDTVYGDADDVLLDWYYHTDGVPAGGEGPDFTKDLALPATIPAGYAGNGTVYVYMKADGTNAIAETSESNNLAILALSTAASYDLSGAQCLVPASAKWGQTITVNAQIGSPGPTTVTDFFHVDFYLSNDTIFGDGDDVLLGFYTHYDDVPGSGYGPMFARDLPLPATVPAGYSSTGTVYIGMKTDSDNRITETAENNNFGVIGQTYDWASLSISPADAAPTDMAISASSVPENRPVGTVVGTLSTTDPDAGDTFTYTLVSGAGSTDNASFTISGNQLRTAASFDFETKSSYSIRVRSTDQGGLWAEKVFTITVTDVDEIAPTVTAVYVRGSTWASGYLSFLAANTAGSSSTYGYAIPVGTGATQLQTLPWRNLNRISIAFSEDVSIAQAQFAIAGSVGSYSVSGFAYSSADHVATWSLAAAIGPDKLDVAVPGSGSTPVRDAAGNVLDGEWVNPTSYSDAGSTDTFPSGNAAVGGNFAFRFDVLPGDSTGGSLGKVNVADALQTKGRSGLPVTVSIYRSDFDGNNLVNVADVLYVKSKSSIYSLPVNPPVLPVFSAMSVSDDLLSSGSLSRQGSWTTLFLK